MPLTTVTLLGPPLMRAYDDLPEMNPLKSKFSGFVKELRGWGFWWAVDSVPTSLAIYYGQELNRRMNARREDLGYSDEAPYFEAVKRRSPSDLLASLNSAMDRLTVDFGSWMMFTLVNIFAVVNENLLRQIGGRGVRGQANLFAFRGVRPIPLPSYKFISPDFLL